MALKETPDLRPASISVADLEKLRFELQAYQKLYSEVVSIKTKQGIIEWWAETTMVQEIMDGLVVALNTPAFNHILGRLVKLGKTDKKNAFYSRRRNYRKR